MFELVDVERIDFEAVLWNVDELFVIFSYIFYFGEKVYTSRGHQFVELFY